MRKHLVDARLVNLWKEPLDRIVHIDFEKQDAGDNKIQVFLRLELTGRSANAYLVDALGNTMGTPFEQDGASPARVPSPEFFDPIVLLSQLDESIARPRRSIGCLRAARYSGRN